MLKTEARLLNKICKTDFFNVLLADTSSTTDYIKLVDVYCSFLYSRSQSAFLNEPRAVQSRWWPTTHQSSQPSPDALLNLLFNETERSKITLTVQLSNDVILEIPSKSAQSSNSPASTNSQTLSNPSNSNNSYQIVKALDTRLRGSRFFFNEFSYSFLDVIVFSSLQKCRIWPKVIKEGKKSRQDLPALVDWYKLFLKDHREDIEYKFDPSVVRDKYHKQLEQEKNERRNDVPLLEAVKRGDTATIIDLVRNHGSDVESREPRMWKRAAHLAAELGNLEVCRTLDSLGCRWDALDKEEQTPIFYAVTSSSLSVVEYLIEEKHVDHQHKEYQARTPFYLACFVGYMPIIELLLRKGVDVNYPSKLGRCALSKACYLGYMDVVRILLDQPEINVTLQDSKGRTSMHNAAWGAQGGKDGKRKGAILLNDSPESIQLLFDKGHPIDLVDFEGNSSLMSAASSDARDSLELLVRLGANPCIVNTQGETAAFLAAKFGHVEMLRTLVETYNVNPNLPDNSGTTPAQIAAIHMKSGCLTYLSSLKAGGLSKQVLITPTPDAAVGFLRKIHDSFYTDSEQLAIFELYSSSLEGGLASCCFFESLTPNLRSFLVNDCLNLKLVEAIIKQISHKLSPNEAKDIFMALALSDQLPRAIHLICNQNTTTTTFKSEIEEAQLKKQKLEMKFTAEDILNIMKVCLKPTTPDNAIEHCLFELNSTWMESTDSDSAMTPTLIIQKLCEHRRMAVIVKLIDFIMNPINSLTGTIETAITSTTTISHAFLFSNPNMNRDVFTHEKIREMFLASSSATTTTTTTTTTNQLNSLDICVLAKANDIHHVIESFLREFLHEEPVQKYRIPKYTLEILTIESNPIASTATPTTEATKTTTTSPVNLLLTTLNAESEALNTSLKAKEPGNEQRAKDLCYVELTETIEKTIESRPLYWIDRVDSSEMNQLLEAIHSGNIFGVDLEYFAVAAPSSTTTPLTSNNTVTAATVTDLGFVCTIQISSVTADFVIDAMRVREELFDCLNASLFANPAKVKVMHGCSNDLVWLKRDFNIDVVCLFDTMKAHIMIMNEHQSSSLKAIALKHIDEDLDKSFQLSDWRIRPLPSAMLLYARIDSFVLLRLYSALRTELLKKSLLSHMQLACMRILIKNFHKHTHSIKLNFIEE